MPAQFRPERRRFGKRSFGNSLNSQTAFDQRTSETAESFELEAERPARLPAPSNDNALLKSPSVSATPDAPDLSWLLAATQSRLLSHARTIVLFAFAAAVGFAGGTILNASVAWAAFLAAFLGGPLLVAYCWRRGMVAEITERHSHTFPTPHGGGALIVLVAIPIGGLALVFAGTGQSAPLWQFVMMGAGLIVGATGWIEDRIGLKNSVRLIAQFAAVCLPAILLPPMFDIIPIWLEKIVVIVAWVWFINLFNFMDGADGVAGSEAVFLASALAVLSPGLAPLALVVAGTSLGFLRVNWRPARLFLGDTGSTWLGYMLGGLLLLSVASDAGRLILPMATLPLVFCADATWTVISRTLRGFRPWLPHNEFWFHRALASGLRHDQLALAVAGLNFLLFTIAALSLAIDFPFVSLPIGLCVLAIVAIRIREREGRLTVSAPQAVSSASHG